MRKKNNSEKKCQNFFFIQDKITQIHISINMKILITNYLLYGDFFKYNEVGM